MSKNRDAGLTPQDASQVLRNEAMETESIGSSCTDTASYLNGEETLSRKDRGLSSSEDKHFFGKRIISPNIRVPVLSANCDTLMPTKASRAKWWIRTGKAIPIRTKLGLFAVVLTVEPSGYEIQPILLSVDPGSSFAGVSVCSKSGIHCGFNLELPGRQTKERITARREMRHSRRGRKCRRRKCRDAHRVTDITPSILARRRFELRIVNELRKTFPIHKIILEDVSADHCKKRGPYFSHAEIGKAWFVDQLKKVVRVELHKGWQTSKKRKEIGLSKSKEKDSRDQNAHVNDAISMCVLSLGDIPLNSNYFFDVLRRPKYCRRMLHIESPSKGGVRRRYGGTTTPFNYRKGDYVECRQADRTCRGWVSGYYLKTKTLSVSDFDWTRLGEFVLSKTRMIHRNQGFLRRGENVVV